MRFQTALDAVFFGNAEAQLLLHAPTQVGDGTTTVVILAGELLRESKAFIEEGVHPRAIMRSFRQAGALAVQHVQVTPPAPSPGPAHPDAQASALTPRPAGTGSDICYIV